MLLLLCIASQVCSHAHLHPSPLCYHVCLELLAGLACTPELIFLYLAGRRVPILLSNQRSSDAIIFQRAPRSSRRLSHVHLQQCCRTQQVVSPAPNHVECLVAQIPIKKKTTVEGRARPQSRSRDLCQHCFTAVVEHFEAGDEVVPVD